MSTCEHCGKPWDFTPLCGECEELACETCGRVECCCSEPVPQHYSEWALTMFGQSLPQPESLDRFVRAARLQPGLWGAADANAKLQVSLFLGRENAA